MQLRNGNPAPLQRLVVMSQSLDIAVGIWLFIQWLVESKQGSAGGNQFVDCGGIKTSVSFNAPLTAVTIQPKRGFEYRSFAACLLNG